MSRWETLLNRKGTTWRSLPDERKARRGRRRQRRRADAGIAVASIKRPVLAGGGAAHVGFSDDLYQQIFKTSNA